ncbi:hypothetical protein [Streptomyces sp. YPW6]|uniref:hypothetical protein n=1 Tax=Streptomyces sp. YPW6 TaxID=2840373 RepID=UPI003D764B14
MAGRAGRRPYAEPIEAGAKMRRYDWYGGEGFEGNCGRDPEVRQAKTFAGLSMDGLVRSWWW